MSILQLNKNRLALLCIFGVAWILLILRYVGGNGEHAWPDSDGVLFSLMAMHLMQGESFSWFLYGQDYMGTFPVLINYALFQLFGISHLWVEFFYAFVYASSLAIISAFIIKRTGFVVALVFACLFCLFPTELDNLKALDSGNHNFSILMGLITSYFFCLFIQLHLEKKQNLSFNNYLSLLFFCLLAGLTYWSSKLGFIYIIAIVGSTVISCRKQLGLPNVFNINKALSFSQHPIIYHLKKWFWFILLLIFLSLFLIFEQAIFNAFLIFKIYFIFQFSKIPEPMNYFWGIVPLIAGTIYLIKNKARLSSMIRGNEKSVPWDLVILTAPLLVVLFALPTTEHLDDFTSIRYFESLQWLNLILLPLLLSLLPQKTIRNSLSLFYFVIALYSWYFPEDWNFKRMQQPLQTIEFIQTRQADESRLIEDEKAVLTFLDARNLYYGYADYWLAYRLTFLTHEEFIISPYEDSRYPAYDKRIENEGNGFYLFYIEELGNGREFAKEHGKTQEAIFGDLIVFY